MKLLILFALFSVGFTLTTLQNKLSNLLSSNCATKNGIDLSSLTSVNDYTFALKNTSITFRMNVCSNTNTPCGGSASSPIYYKSLHLLTLVFN